MVQRTSTPVEIGGQQQGRIQQAEGGYVNPDVNAELTRQVDSGRDRILQGILGEIESTARKGHKRSLEDAYLAGAAKVGQIESEDQLEGDIFTKDWAVAGYRDTNARFSMADREATIAKDMGKLRQEAPEKFNAYLAQQRASLMPQLEGMSREARNAAFGQLVTSERAAIKTHAAEHAKWQVEVKQQSWASKTLSTVAALDMARKSGDPTAYESAIGAGVAHGAAIWQTPEFNEAKRRDLTMQYAEHALTSDNVALYEQLRDMTFGPEKQSMLARLTPDQQEKLAGKYREAQQRTAFESNTQYVQAHAQLVAAMESGTYLPTHAELTARLGVGVRLGVIKQGEYESTMQKFYKAQYDVNNGVALANAYLTNDTATIRRLGTDAKAEEALMKHYQKSGVPLQRQVAELTAAGVLGNEPAFKVAGTLYDRAIGGIVGPDGKMNVQHAEMFVQLDTTLKELEKSPQGAAGAINLMAGMSKDNAIRVQRIRALTQSGMPTDAAITKALEDEVADSKLTPQQKAVRATMKAEKDDKFLRSLEEGGIWHTMSTKVRAFFGSQEAQVQGILAVPNVAPRVRGAYLEDVKGALYEEFNNIDLTTPNIPQEERLKIAAGALQQRVAKLDSGPLVLPKGSTVQSFFGVKGVSQDSIEAAVSTLTKPMTEDHSSRVRVLGDRLQVQQYDAEGNATSEVKYISKSEVQAQIARDQRTEAKKLEVLYGEAGKTVQPRGAKLGVQYNGANGAGVDAELMLQFRDNLVQNEGVRDTPYEDLSGKVVDGKKVQTVGVGVSSHNKHYPKSAANGGAISQAELNESFRGASSDAAITGSQVQKQYNLNDAGFLLASELAYQSGTAFHKTSGYAEFMQSLSTADANKAIKAFSRTPAYKHSGALRREHYERLIRQTMKG